MKLDKDTESGYAEGMNNRARKRNPFEVFETIMKWVGRGLGWLLVGLVVVALLVMLPIVGTLEGWSWDRTWMGWILVAICALTVLGMYPALVVVAWVYGKWDTAKRKWERKNNGR